VETIDNMLEFDVLSTPVRFRSDTSVHEISAKEIVDFVCSEALKIKDNSPHLEDKHLATLVALKIAEELLSMRKEYQSNIERLQLTAKEALDFISATVIQ